MQTVFITGGTGYIGCRLIKALLDKGGYTIRALVRTGSEYRLPSGCEKIIGNALDARTYSKTIRPATILIHLVGVPHPSPSKKQQFREIDLVSVQQAAIATNDGSIEHIIYLSVAQYPANIMKDYQEVRASGEALLSKTGIKCSFIRPWYVLGPGHWWPLLLKPVYWAARLVPSFREMAEKLNTVTIHQMIETLTHAIENPPASHCRIYEVNDIQMIGRTK
jgi:uncharacterized protein YbjT (DUF2867 family)